MKIVRTVARPARGAASVPRDRCVGGLVPDHGRPARRSPGAGQAGQGGERRRGDVDLRQPHPVQRSGRPERLPAGRGRPTPSWPPAPASTCCSCRPPPRSTRRASVRPLQLHGPIVETLEGARRGVGHFAGRHHGGQQAARHGAAGSRLLRREGRPAGPGGAGPGGRPEHRHRDRDRADRPGARRAGDVQPQPPARPGRAHPATGSVRRAARGAADELRGRMARSTSSWPRPTGSWPTTASPPSTWPWSTPTRSCPRTTSGYGPPCCWSRRRSAEPG